METMNPIDPGTHTLPPLPYSVSSLEPIISAQTLQIHHGKHHKKYVDSLNQVELSLAKARKNNDYKNINLLEDQLAFNGSGHILHSVYWTNMTGPGEGGAPGPYTSHCVDSYFGGIQQFQAQFSAVAKGVEGSGWCILGFQPAFSRLELLQCKNHQNLTQWGIIPILVCDVWEHAYYLQYQNNRDTFVDKWWQLVNWADVEHRLIGATQGALPLTTT